MNKRLAPAQSAARTAIKPLLACIFLPFLLAVGNLANANQGDDIAGIIDQSISDSNVVDPKELAKQVKKEQKQLAKQDRKQLKVQADKGERLAQVALGSDFASEAQLLTFAPAAANDALSDALRWYSLAAKRGYPGAPSLDNSGVSFYPVRVVRN